MAKRTRNKGGKRAYLKRWSAAQVKVGKGKGNRSRVSKQPIGYDRDTGESFPNPVRAAHMAVKRMAEEIPPTRILNASYWDNVPVPPSEAKAEDGVITKQYDPAPPRFRVMQKWASLFGRGHGEEEFHEVKLLNSHKRKLSMFFSGDKYFFLEEKAFLVKRSIIYPSRDRAMFAFRRDQIVWVQSKVLSPSPPPLNSP